MHVGNYLGLAHQSEKALAKALEQVADHHRDEPDIYQMCQTLASWSQEHAEGLKPLVSRYSENKNEEPENLHNSLFDKPRSGSLGLLRDLHDLWLMANEVQLSWIVLQQASMALHDKELEQACLVYGAQTKRQVNWLLARVKQAAPQSLVVAEK